MMVWIFSHYREALPLASVPLLLMLLVATPFAAAYLMGTSGRKSSDQGGMSTGQRRIQLIAASMAALAAVHIALMALGESALERGGRGAGTILTEILLGPPQYKAEQLLAFSAIILVLGVIAAGGTAIAIADGGPIREKVNLWRDPPRQRGEYGSANFCLPREFLRLQQKAPGTLVLQGGFWGKRTPGDQPDKWYRLDAGPLRPTAPGICFSMEDQARGMVIIGPAGTGKSQAGILPVVADTMYIGHDDLKRHGHSLILVDPQGELTPHILKYAGVTGHQVILHDPTDPSMPHYNLVRGIESVSDAETIAQVLLGTAASHGSHSFWENSAHNLLAACLLSFDNLGDILLALSDIRALADVLSADERTRRLAAGFLSNAYGDGRRAGDVVATVQAGTLTKWAEDNVREATETSDFSAEMLVAEPSIVVLKCPARYMSVYGPYLGTVLHRLMVDLDSLASKAPNGALPRHVKIVLDEFPMLGRLDPVIQAVNTFRKRNISFMIAAQTISQLELVYGKQAAEALIAGMATQIYLGSCDEPTASYVSQMLGSTTEYSKSRRPGEQPSAHGRKLLNIEEVVKPPRGNSVIVHRYATTSFATQLVLLAQFRPMWDRDDWNRRIAQAKAAGKIALCLAPSPFSKARKASTSAKSSVPVEPVPVTQSPKQIIDRNAGAGYYEDVEL